MAFLLKHLLVATDLLSHPGTTLDRAVAVAQRNGAEVTLLHVLSDIGVTELPLVFDPQTKRLIAQLDPFHAQLCRDSEKRLAEFARSRSCENVAIKPEVRVGQPATAVVQAAYEHDVDIVFVGTRGLTGFERIVLGSITQALIRHAPGAVWAVQADSPKPLQAIVAATDLSDVSGRALQLAGSLSESLQAPLHVVHAIEAVESRQTMDFGDQLPQLARRETEHGHRQRLTDFVQSNAGPLPPERLHIGWGKPGNVINEFAMRLKADLVVLGTVGRSGLPGVILGNTAETVLHSLNCDILAVKPVKVVA